MTTTKINLAILSALFALALLVAPTSVMIVQAQNYDAGEEYEGFTFNHDDADAEEAKEACDEGGDYDECEECIDNRDELQGLKGYEAVKCLKDPQNSY